MFFFSFLLSLLFLLQGCFRRNVTVVTIYASLGEEALCHSLNEVFVFPLSLIFHTYLPGMSLAKSSVSLIIILGTDNNLDFSLVCYVYQVKNISLAHIYLNLRCIITFFTLQPSYITCEKKGAKWY